MSGPFDFLHIKRRTEGSSNELSFDVLDAARSDADDQQRRNTRKPAEIKPFQDSYHGVIGSSTFSAAPEVVRRKRARREHTRRVWLIACVAIVAFIGTGAYLGYLYYQGKSDFGGRFDTLIDRFVDIDKTMVEIDELMQDPMKMVDVEASSDSSEASNGNEEPGMSVEAQQALKKIPSLKREMNAIAGEAQKLKESANLDEERAALSQVEIAALARGDMFEHSEEVLEIAKKTASRVVKTNDAWNKVLQADQIARDATEMANEASTEETTLEARRQTENARVLFIEAKEDLEAIETDKPSVNFTEEKKYIDKRTRSLEAAVKTANALLANNREGAVSANNEYNEADKEAASFANKLPSSEGTQVVQAYQSQFENAVKAYNQSRASVATADSSLRAYLEDR